MRRAKFTLFKNMRDSKLLGHNNMNESQGINREFRTKITEPEDHKLSAKVTVALEASGFSLRGILTLFSHFYTLAKNGREHR